MKPEYDAGKNLKEQMESAVALYDSEMSLQAIGEELGLNPIKVRKLLITAGVYESEVAEKVQATFQEYRETQDYKTSILSTANSGKCPRRCGSAEIADGRGSSGLWRQRLVSFQIQEALPIENGRVLDGKASPTFALYRAEGSPPQNKSHPVRKSRQWGNVRGVWRSKGRARR